jgi:hypothetical protein
MPDDSKWGCDHHGRGQTPCGCDFCKYVFIHLLSPIDLLSVRLLRERNRMGKPVTAKIYDQRCKSQHGQGLDLPRGPDPRSHNRASAAINEVARGLLGLDA